MIIDSTDLHLMIVAFVTVGGGGLGLLGLLFGPKRGWTILGFLFALATFGGAGVAISLRLPPEFWTAMLAVGTVALALSAVRCRWLTRAAAWLILQAQQSRLQGVVLLLLAPAFVFWWLHQSDQQVPFADESALSPGIEVDPTQLQPVAGIHAATDQGRPVPVYTVATAPTAEDLLKAEQKFVRDQSLAQKQIRTAGPDQTYNCHGWVFTDGHFWVRGGDVPAILEGNGYCPVTQPQPGDVIVYSDREGNVSHTGLVRTASEDGLVVIESKWGWMGRYLHRPDEQCYGSNFAYYRTDRGHHRVQGVGGETPHLGLPSE